MFEHIRNKYGSVNGYLDSIDFTEQFRSDLKETLLHGAKNFIDRMQMKTDKKGKEKEIALERDKEKEKEKQKV